MRYIIFIFILLSKYSYSQDSCDVINIQDYCCKLDNKGKKQGLWKFYQPPNCIIQSEVMYKDDYREGKSIIYFSNGKVMTESYYKNDTLNGLSRTFRKDGSLYREIEYKMGEINGFSKYFDSLGRITSVADYWDGKKNGSLKLYYSNGALEEEIFFVHGVKDGANRLYDSRGNLIREYIWRNNNIEIEKYYCSSILVKEIVRGKGD